MKLKKSKVDFTDDMLPRSRRQIFFDIYKNRFWLVTGLGLILFLFMAPLIVVYAIGNLKVYEINLKVQNGTLSTSEGAKEVFYMVNARNLAVIPCAAVFAVGLSGAIGVIRRLVWLEGVIFWSDFFKSVKENALSFCFVAALFAALNYFLQYLARSLYFYDGFSVQAAICFLIAALLLICLMAPSFITQSTVYNLAFSSKLKNSFMLSMRKPLVSFLLLITNVAPYLTLIIPGKYTFLAVCVLLPIFIMPAQIILNTLCCDSVLDEFVNKQNFPEIYKKGLYNAENND